MARPIECFDGGHRGPRRPATSIVGPLIAAPVARALLRRAALAWTRRAIAALNRGDVGPALAMYARDAVVRQGEGDHRFAGEHRGHDEIDRFLRAMVDAGVHGDVRDLWWSGPPWSLRAIVRFDERVYDHDGTVVYENELAFVLRLRAAKIVDHTDLVLSTGRLERLESHLLAR